MISVCGTRALYKSVFPSKRPDFDGIGQSCPYKDIFFPSQRSFWAQKRNNISKINQATNFFSQKSATPVYIFFPSTSLALSLYLTHSHFLSFLCTYAYDISTFGFSTKICYLFSYIAVYQQFILFREISVKQGHTMFKLCIFIHPWKK